MKYAFHLLKLKNKGGLVTPSQGTVKILMLIEKSLRQTMNALSAKNVHKKQCNILLKEKLAVKIPCY